MKNKPVLQDLLKAHGYSINEAAKVSGIRYDTIWKHCMGLRVISPEMALRYEKRLHIPKCLLRPDLWPPESSPTTPPEGALPA